MRPSLATLLALALAGFGLSATAFAQAPGAPASAAASAPASAAASAAAAPASAPASAAAVPAGPKHLAAVDVVTIGLKLDAVDQATAEDLARLIKSGSVQRADLRDAKNGPRFLHLAARSKDPEVVASALKGLRTTYSSSSAGRRKSNAITEDFRKVVRGRLMSEDDRVRSAAYNLTSKLLAGTAPDTATLDLVIKHLSDASPGRRIRAIDALVNVADFQLDSPRKGPLKEKVTTALLTALEAAAEPAVLASGLETLGQVGFPAMPLAARAVALANKHVAHAEPAVRGMAMLVISRVTKAADASATASITKGLIDAEPLVRGASVLGASHIAAPARIEALMKLVDDNAVPQREVGGFTDLDGRPGTVRVRAGGSRVCVGALDALYEVLASKGVKPPVVPGKVGTDELLALRREHVKAWYAKNGKK
jgi:HEAT repeat protein